MARLQTHRGPDEEGFFENGQVALGIRRLSVIDLETGHQPMTNESGNVWVVFNGEIYNFKELRSSLEAKGHRFNTQSDTEVLVHGYEEWGEELPIHLRGMFAFAICDQRSGEMEGGHPSSGSSRLFLARDHFGIKPLYYAEINGALVFASEIKSILSLPGVSREMDPEALGPYLSFLYVPEPRTMYKSVRALPPGHLLTLEKRRVSVRQYCTLRPAPDRFKSPQESVRQIRAAVEDSVRSMLVADVPLGLFLSGGMDSASILAMMTRYMEGPVQTFSLGFGEKEKRWDELEAARRVASFFKTDHHEFYTEPNIVELIPRVVEHFDQPFANPTALMLYLLSTEARRYVKVALAGTGGDEMFAGYPRYAGMWLYQGYRYLPEFLRKGIAGLSFPLVHDSTDGRLWPQRIRRFLEGGALSFEDCYARFLSVPQQGGIGSIFSPSFEHVMKGVDPASFLQPYLRDGQGLPELERLMQADLNTYLPFNQLVYGDRMSMAQSLELRVPFVDQRLAEIAGSIPLRLKMPWGTTKGLFREAMAPLLPQEIIRAPKKGFNLPIALWLKEDLRGWARSLLSPKRVRQRGYFRPEAITSILEEHGRGRRDHSLLLWALLVLEVWHQLYLDP